MSDKHTVSGINAQEHSTLSGFKAAVYDEAGSGSWIVDMKLEVLWREVHNEEIPDYLQPLLKDDE